MRRASSSARFQVISTTSPLPIGWVNHTRSPVFFSCSYT